MLNEGILNFLRELEHNNNREWFGEHKQWYEQSKAEAQQFLQKVYSSLSEIDSFHEFKMYRIYRDVRFSKDKTPYKAHFSAIYKRKQPHNRGSFYVQIKPGASVVGAGFWGPNAEDMLRIRKAIALEDDLEIVLANKKLQKSFGELKGEKLKNVPRGFDKSHPRAELLKHKQFLLIKNYSDEEVLKDNFFENVIEDYKIVQAFLEYMTAVLTTNENGESLFD